MEGRIFHFLCTYIRSLGKTHSFKGKQFSDATIVMVYLWSVLWDRPVSWACQLSNWPANCHWQRLPSCSTMSRRLKSIGVLTLIQQVQSLLDELFPGGLCKLVDSKPMPVSVYSKDSDARLGHGAGLPAKGYKLHSIADARSRHVERWTVASMNRHDAAIAVELIDSMPNGQATYLIGDNAYDSNHLYELAAQAGTQLLAPQRKSAKELGKRRHSPHRIVGHKRLANPLKCTGQTESFGMSMLKCRIAIEQTFAYTTNIPQGLSGLPNWVRRPHRVALWVALKLQIAAASQIIKKRVA
jgi:DDE family transposase